MSKRAMVLACLSLLLALPALAQVDEVIYGADEIVNDHFGAVPDPNEHDLWKNHDWNDGGNGDDNVSNSDNVGDDPPVDNAGGDNAPVPEPATGILLGMGVLGLARMMRRRKPSE